MTSSSPAPIEPVRLASLEDLAPLPASFWIAASAIAAACVVIGGAISWWAWRDLRRAEPPERAFRALARRLRLTPGQKTLIRRMARGAEVPAIALLLSESAFFAGAASADPNPAVDRLRRLLFPAEP